jgi:hypothetical protein
LDILCLAAHSLRLRAERDDGPLANHLQWSPFLVTVALALIAEGQRELTRTIAERQTRDAEIVHRAYLSVEPGGLHPPVGRPEGEHVVLGHVRFKNVGHVPAQNVSWALYIKPSLNGELNDFPIAESDFREGLVIFPESAVTRRSDSINVTHESGWIYVWGEIKYDDGFGGPRRLTKYCHRYNREVLRLLEGRAGHGILEADARFHDHGNKAT